MSRVKLKYHFKNKAIMLRVNLKFKVELLYNKSNYWCWRVWLQGYRWLHLRSIQRGYVVSQEPITR